MKARREGRQDQLLLGGMRRWAWVLVGSQSSSQHSGEGGGFGGSSALFCICNGDNSGVFLSFFVWFFRALTTGVESNIYYAAAEITSRSAENAKPEVLKFHQNLLVATSESSSLTHSLTGTLLPRPLPVSCRPSPSPNTTLDSLQGCRIQLPRLPRHHSVYSSPHNSVHILTSCLLSDQRFAISLCSANDSEDILFYSPSAYWFCSPEPLETELWVWQLEFCTILNPRMRDPSSSRLSVDCSLSVHLYSRNVSLGLGFLKAAL